MPVLNTVGDALCGVSVGLSINGVTPAAMVGVPIDHARWLDDTKAVFQNNSGGTSVIGQYDTGTLALTTLDSLGLSGLGAGGGNWVAFLAGGVGKGVRTSVAGCGPFPNGGNCDASETGVMGFITYAPLGRGVSIYSAAGAPLSTIGSTLFYTDIYLRSGLLSYSINSGGLAQWRLMAFSGAGVTYSPRAQSLGPVIPVVLASTDIWVLERSDKLTIRQKDSDQGYVIEASVEQNNPDAREISPGVVRIAFSTDAGESPGALVRVDLMLATGANTRSVGSGAFNAQTAFTLTTLPVGTPVSGGGSSGGGPGGGGGRPTNTAIITRRVKAAAKPPSRTYPEVDRIRDLPAQRSLRLLWDKVYDVHERLDAANTRIQQVAATQITDLQKQMLSLTQQVQSFGAFAGGTGGSGGGGGGGGKSDGGEGDLGCGEAGSTGHVTAGSPLTRETVGKVVCGTGNEFPALLAIVVDQPTRDANRSELLGRMIWHLNLAGFPNVSRYPGNPFTLLIDIAGVQNAYRVTDYATFDVAMATCMVFGGTSSSPTSPDAGIPD